MSEFQPARWTGGKKSVQAVTGGGQAGTAPKPAAASAAPYADGPDATDAAKSLAADNNIDLATVKGTGADGRITKDDVVYAIDQRDLAANAEADDTDASWTDEAGDDAE